MKFTRLLITLSIALFLIIGTYIAIKWAKGYRLNLKDQTIQGTGLLVVNSEPKGASIYIDDKLTSATDQTLHLSPKSYHLRLEKEGYHPWTKDLNIEAELVTQTNARLFPTTPDLSALTFNGVNQSYPSPNGNKIAFQIASGSAQTKHGIWILDLNDNFLKQGSNNFPIAIDTNTTQFSQAQLFWSPSSNQILAYFNDIKAYLLDVNQLNQANTTLNVAFQLESIIDDWQQQLSLEKAKKIQKLPLEMQTIATSSATLTYFSPNEEKLLYTATGSATINPNLIPPLPSINSQPQQRQLISGNTYVYDLKEDTNFLIQENHYSQKELDQISSIFSLPEPDLTNTLNSVAPTIYNQLPQTKKLSKSIFDSLLSIQYQYSPIYPDTNIQWYPDSSHLIITDTNGIYISYYDKTNLTRIYPGIFANNFAYPWPNGKKLILISSLSNDPNILPNFYSLNLE